MPQHVRVSTVEGTGGHALRVLDWDAPSRVPRRGHMLFLGGRGDFAEKYLEVMGHWHAAGWEVTTADWRGQGGSGRLGADATTGHVDDFGDYMADLDIVWRRTMAAAGAAAAGPRVVIAHSMGGHLALRAVAERRIAPDALVLVAPMLGFRTPLPNGVTRRVARLMGRVGDPRRPAWKWGERPGEPPLARGPMLTHDADRYADELWWRARQPELASGPGSWGWLAAASDSIAVLARPGLLERVTVPVLLVATTADRLVSPTAIAAAARRLPNAEVQTFGSESAHEILREADPVRLRAIARIDAFLDRVAGA